MNNTISKFFSLLIILYRNIFKLFLICVIIYFLIAVREFVNNTRYQTVSVDENNIAIFDTKTGLTYLVHVKGGSNNQTKVISSTTRIKNN